MSWQENEIKISLLNLAEIPFEENCAAAISHQADVMLSIKLEIVFPLKKIWYIFKHFMNYSTLILIFVVFMTIFSSNYSTVFFISLLLPVILDDHPGKLENPSTNKLGSQQQTCGLINWGNFFTVICDIQREPFIKYCRNLHKLLMSITTVSN